MRLFTGIELPPPVRKAATLAVVDLREQCARHAPRAQLRWVEPSNLHITLWFLGEVADARVDDVVNVFRAPFETRVFRLAIAGAGAFPESGPPRAVWFGIRAGAPQLAALHDELTARFVRLGFPQEKRAYSAHLTVARVKDVRRSDVPSIRRIVREPPREIGEWDVAEATLFRSRLSPKGSQYESLLRVPLS